MANDCKLSAAEQKRLANPSYARDTVQYGVHTQREVDDCVSAGQPSMFDKLKGSLGAAFEKAKDAVTPLDQAVGNGLKAGAEMAANGVTQNTGLTGRAAEAIQNRGAQLKRQEAELGI